jgi:hypothetical protein
MESISQIVVAEGWRCSPDERSRLRREGARVHDYLGEGENGECEVDALQRAVRDAAARREEIRRLIASAIDIST